MKKSIGWIVFLTLTAAIAAFGVFPAFSQDKAADNTQIMIDKLKADKKLVVAANMDLTESEAQGFWPVYDEYQKELAALNQRLGKLIDSYAADYNANTLTDEKAKKLTEEFLAIGKDEAKLPASFVPKLNKVLPAKKVLRYLQIENKIRSLIKYSLAEQIPLVM
jgi:hypothetical protein